MVYREQGGKGVFTDHLIYPLLFLIKQIGILIPFLIMSFFLIKKINIRLNFKDEKLIFLIFTTIVPILLIFLTSSMIIGAKIRTMWMTPFYLFFGILIIYTFQKKIELNKFKKIFYYIPIFIYFISFTYLIVSLYNDQKRTDYPGKEIARLVQEKWDKNFRNEIENLSSETNGMLEIFISLIF